MVSPCCKAGAKPTQCVLGGFDQSLAVFLLIPCVCAMQVAQGMLWVWGDSSPAAHIHASATPAHTVPWMDMQARMQALYSGVTGQSKTPPCRMCFTWCRSLSSSLRERGMLDHRNISHSPILSCCNVFCLKCQQVVESPVPV